MDKKSITGLLIIAAILFVWTKYFTPPPVEDAEADKEVSVHVQDDAEGIVDTNTTDTRLTEDRMPEKKPIQLSDLKTKEDSIRWKMEQESLMSDHGIFYPSVAEGESANPLTIENDKIKVYISPKGGAIEKVVLKEYKSKSADGDSLVLMDERSNISLMMPFGRDYLNTDNYMFQPMGTSFAIGEGQTDKLVMRLNTSDPNKYVEFTYTMEGGDYEVDFNVAFHNLDHEIDLLRDNLVYNWDLIGLSHEKSATFEDRKSTVFYKYKEEDRSYLSETKDDELELESDIEWIAMKQYFFSAVAIPESGFIDDHSTLSIKMLEDSSLTKEYTAEINWELEESSTPSGNIKYFFGPNQYKVLKKYDNGMEHIIDMGWGIFGWMNRWLVIPTFNFLSKYIGSYGVIILLLTLFIKMLLFPLTYKNFLSSAKMKMLKPDIEEINKKFKDDAMKKQQATLSLYRQTGVNPMAGCVPMLIQMPVLYAMFNFFPSAIELRQKSFLWASDLSSYDSIMSIPKLPFYGDHVSLFTLLMAISTILYTRMNSAQMPESQPGMPNMKVMMYIFPVMMLFFFNNYPSGLSYYYLLANVISITQMFVIKNYIIDEKKIRAKIELNKKTPKKKSKFQQRMEEASRQQQASKKRKK